MYQHLIAAAPFWLENGAAPAIACSDLAAQFEADPAVAYAALQRLDLVERTLQAVCYVTYIKQVTGATIAPGALLAQWIQGDTTRRCAGFIYAIENTVTPGVYIGQSVQPAWQRWGEHRRRLRGGQHHCWQLQAAWDTYGEPAFVFRVLQACVTDLDAAEIAAIRAHRAVYNTIGVL